MLPITNLAGDTELLTGVKGLRRKRKVNGEKSVAFFVVPDDSNGHTFGMVDVESIAEFDGEEYVIKAVTEKNVGIRTIKEVSAVHKFFCDMIDNHKYEKYTGSLTFGSALQFIFEGTGYTFSIIDSFLAQSFENFGDDNRLALLQTVLERYGAEFYVIGKQVYFEREIGNKTDFQFRYAHNVKTIDKQVTSNNLATYIRGYGKQNEDGSYVVEAEYTSPNAEKLGIRHAPAVRDERYTTYDGLLERLQNDLIDEPQLSITIDFADLRASGYLYEQPGEGDYGFIIYEPMGLDVEARIVEIDEEFNANLEPIRSSVTLSNLREGIKDVLTRFEQTSKQVGRLMEGRDQLPYSALDEAVRNATEALQSAQTELEFSNGIIAREKSNPNKLVLFNSAGLGISTDGGSTFNTAMTADGIVADVVTSGQLNSNNVTVGNSKIQLNSDGVFVYKEGVVGASLVEGNLTFNDQSDGQRIGRFAATVWSDFATKGISMNMEQNRYISFGHYVDELTGYSPMMLLNPSESMAGNARGIHMNLPIRMNEDVWLGTKALRFGENNTHNHSSLWHGSDDSLIIAGYTGVRLAHLSSGGTIVDRLTVDDNSVDCWQDLDMHGWKILRVAEVQTSSSILLKTNIEDLSVSGLGVINNLELKQYLLQSDVDLGIYNNWQVGVISEMSPEVATPDGRSINLYKLISYSAKAIQELSQKVINLESRVSDIESVM